MAVATSPETEHVAIFMESVEYINSNGCGGLIFLHHEVKKRGFQLFIVGPGGRVARVMKRLGSYNILRVRQSLGEVITEVEMILQLAKEQIAV
jgi:anti-anti-sigma factor